MGPIFAGRGWVISGLLADRFGSRFGTKTNLLRGVIGPIFTRNDYLNTVIDNVVSLRGSCRNKRPSHGPHGKKLQPEAGLSLRVKSIPLQERNMLLVDRPVK